jgi:hypothetical protein
MTRHLERIAMALLYQPRGWRDERAGGTPRAKEMTALWLLMIVLVALIIVVPVVWLLTRSPEKPPDPPAANIKQPDPPPVVPEKPPEKTPPGPDKETAELIKELKKDREALQAQVALLLRQAQEKGAAGSPDTRRLEEAMLHLNEEMARLNLAMQQRQPVDVSVVLQEIARLKLEISQMRQGGVTGPTGPPVVTIQPGDQPVIQDPRDKPPRVEQPKFIPRVPDDWTDVFPPDDNPTDVDWPDVDPPDVDWPDVDWPDVDPPPLDDPPVIINSQWPPG